MSDKVFKILLVVLGLLIIGLLTTILFHKPPIDNSYKKEIAAKDEVIQSVMRERDTYRAWKDEAIKVLQSKDSALQVKYQTTVIKYEKIPVNILNLSNEELRRAVYNY